MDLRKSGVQCCVSDCRKSKRNNEDLMLFKFPPKDTKLGQIWREKCNVSYLELPTKRLVICNNHFNPEDIGKRKLKSGAAPVKSLNVATAIEEYFDPPFEKQRRLNSNEFSSEGTLTTIPQFEIIEIDENIIKNEPLILKRKSCYEVYFDFIEENCLKCVCTTCNDSQSSVDEMFHHINENKDTCGNIYFEKYEKVFTSGKKSGEVFINGNYETEFLCLLCNEIISKKNIIFTHLTQHVNDYKKTINAKDYLSNASGIQLQFRKKFLDIYLAENPNHNFLYVCSSCDFKDMKFRSMCNHLEQKTQTCGNFDNNIKLDTNEDDSLEKTLSKVCEVYMDAERKAYFMCLCCNEYYSEKKLVFEHLLVHLNNKKIAERTKTSDSGLKIVSAESLAPIFEEVLNSIKLEYQKIEKGEKRDHYECKICKKSLGTIYTLRDHFRMAHSILFTQNILHELPNLSQEELMKFKKGKDKRKSVDISYEGSLGDSESSPRKCIRPFPDLLPKSLPDLTSGAPNELKETGERICKKYKNSRNISLITNRSEMDTEQYKKSRVEEENLEQDPRYEHNNVIKLTD